MILRYKVEDQAIKRVSAKVDVVAESVKYLKMSFNFSTEWSDVKKYALFYRYGEATPAQVPIVDGVCEVPAECIYAPYMEFSVYGENSNGKLIPTSKIRVDVTPSGLAPGNPPLPPPENLYESVRSDKEQMSKDVAYVEGLKADTLEAYEYVKAHADELEGALTDVENTVGEANEVLDEVQVVADTANANAQTALDIAKGRNQARVFDTTEDLYAWLSDANNAGVCNVGDNLYIVDTDVPDWWISEVLTEVDAETGYYYKIAQLEVQKVDLTDIENDIDSLREDLDNINLSADNVSFDDTIGIGADDMQNALVKVFQFGNNRLAEIVTSLEYSGLGITKTSTWAEVISALTSAYPECTDILDDLIESGISYYGQRIATITTEGKIHGGENTTTGYMTVNVFGNTMYDFTDYTVLKVKIGDMYLPGPLTIGVADTLAGAITDLYELKNGFAGVDVEIDVSEVTGEKYLVFSSYMGKDDNLEAYYYDLDRISLR